MFGKWYAHAYTGSMFGAGASVFAVWGYVVAHARRDSVELNPVHLAAVIGDSVEHITAAIDYLCKSDPDSRNPAEEGRRLIRQGQFIYYIPTFSHYRAMRDEGDRREYNRLRQAEFRLRHNMSNIQTVTCQTLSPSVTDRDRVNAQSEAEAEAEVESSSVEGLAVDLVVRDSKRERVSKFVKPTIENVRVEVAARGNRIDPEAFWNFYEAKGWKVGNQAMKNWKAAIVTWEKRENKPLKGAKSLGNTDALKANREARERLSK